MRTLLFYSRKMCIYAKMIGRHFNAAVSDRRGMTLIEMLVAIALFASVVSLVSVVFVYSVRSQKAITALITANDNTFLMLEQIAREMRVGRGFSLPSDHEIGFTNTLGEAVVYRYGTQLVGGDTHGWLERSVNGGGFSKISANNVNISSFRISTDVGGLPTHTVGDGRPARITLFLSIGALGNSSVKNIFTNIQTTTVVRNLDS